MKLRFFPIAMALILFSPALWASDFSFTPKDRVLVVAPHPDDEALGAAGAIQAAVEAGADVHVVYLTHGESNEISALFYQKKPMILKSDFVKVGRVRKREAVEAMALLGVPEKNLIFFGYPDMGTMPMWERFWSSVKPFRSFFTRINKVIQDDDFSSGKYYRAYNITHDFEKVLLDEKPTHIFVTAPFDLNLDHQAAYLFLTVSLLNLDDEIGPPPAVHLYMIHGHDWPRPRGYLPQEELVPPDVEGAPSPKWNRYPLTDAQRSLKEDSLLCYDSQLSYSKNFLLSFVRKNEIYAENSPETVVASSRLSFASWIAHSGNGEEVRYGAGEKELFVEIPLLYALDEMGTFSTNIFGYKNGVPFTGMPKLRFRLFGDRLFVKDGARNFFDPGVRFKISAGRLFLEVPLKSLHDPEVLFVSTRTAKNRMAFDFGSWRVLRIVPEKAPAAPPSRQSVSRKV